MTAVSSSRRCASRSAKPRRISRARYRLNIVCFRYRPKDVAEVDLDALNMRIGQALLEDGRVYVGTTRYGGRVAFRPAIVNWRTSEADVDLITDVIRELGTRALVAA